GVYDGSASVTTPDSLLLSGFTRLNDQWALSGAVRYSNWKTFDALVIQGSPTGESVINNQWKASWMYSAGADYTLNQRATLRAGLAYETSPVPSAELKNPILPDTDRVWLSFGGSFKLNDKTTLDVAYTHLRGVGDKDITGLGEFKSLNAWIAGAQMQYRF
ncbi:MAG: outer membrane protein transport protein, partial [Burkholderiaceae bacterium]